MKLKVLKELIQQSWTKESSKNPLWSADTPSMGQSDVTALLIQLCCGGNIMMEEREAGNHFYNLIQDRVVDATRKNDDEQESFSHGVEQQREEILSDFATAKRYNVLLNNVRNRLIDIDINGIGGDKRFEPYRKHYQDLIWLVDFEIINYRLKDHVESVLFDFALQNTGYVTTIEHDLVTDEYRYSPCGLDISTDFLKAAIDVGREYKDNLELEDSLTTESSKMQYLVLPQFQKKE